MILLATMFLLSAAAAQAAQNTGGGGAGSTGFMCGEPETPNFCSCTGGIDGPDCKNMKKNCTGDITCPPLLDNCTCKYVPAKSSGGKIKIQKLPPATVKQNQ